MPARDDFEPLHSASNSRRTRLQSRGAMVEWVVVDMVELDPKWAMGRCRYRGAMAMHRCRYCVPDIWMHGVASCLNVYGMLAKLVLFAMPDR